MQQYEIRKNTLPYIHPYSVVQLSTGKVLGQYRTRQMAEKALLLFIKYGVKYAQDINTNINNGFIGLDKRTNQPDGHIPIIPIVDKPTRKIDIIND